MVPLCMAVLLTLGGFGLFDPPTHHADNACIHDVQSIQGPENAVNGVFPIMIASQAAEAGHEVSIFLAGNAVSLMKTEIVDNMSAIGIGKLSDHIKVLKDKGVTIHLSAGSCKARGITEDDIKDKNGVLSGPPGLLKLVEEAEKVLSY